MRDKSEWYRDVTQRRRFAQDLPSPIPDHPGDKLITPERQYLWRQVLARRCSDLVLVIENCSDPHNATAAMRTCDTYGVMRVFVTTDRSSFKINRRMSQGAHKYIDLQVRSDISEVYQQLRAEGYSIYATDLQADSVSGPQALRHEMQDGKKLAVVFGSEGFGLSGEAVDGADGHFLIPMVGVSQSLNLSVSVATTLYALRGDDLAADRPGGMPDEEQQAYYDAWLRAQKGEAVDRAVASWAAKEGTDRKGELLDEYTA